MEILSGKSYGKYTKAPKIAAAQLENLTGVLKFITAQGLKCVSACLYVIS